MSDAKKAWQETGEFVDFQVQAMKETIRRQQEIGFDHLDANDLLAFDIMCAEMEIMESMSKMFKEEK